MGLEINDENISSENQEATNVSTEATTSTTDSNNATQTQETQETVTEGTNQEVTETKEGEESEANDNQSENTESNEFDYSKYEEEFLSTGDVSEASREELYKLFPKNLVDNYIGNMKQATAYALAETEKKAFDIVGGEDSYKTLISWASQNLDKEEKEIFNETVSGSNEKLAVQAIKGLKARMELATTSKKPQVVMGSGDNTRAQLDVFLSRQDYANAIAKPEYQTSPQYRADIDAKLSRTLKSGGYKA